MHRLAIASALVLLALPAAAQFGNPGFYAADTRFERPGVPAPHETNNTDQLFARLAALGGMAEVEFGRLAEQKAQSDAVRDFARRMVEDHSKANDELKPLAEAAEIPLPDELDPEHQAMRDKLEAAEGAAFDLAYIEGQVADHLKAVQTFEWEVAQGQDAALQGFAKEKLPTLMEHLRMAQDLAVEMRVAAAN
jgi:putative membrane protein